VALRHPAADVQHVQRVLSEEHRIICSGRGGNLRVSLHLYNDASDVEVLVHALDTVARRASER
jgi:selenocysteine lyase/cysteine desulfurase